MVRTSNLTSEERKKKTVQAVVKLCKEEEPSSLTTANIAKEMNVTQGALFRHFPSKDSIWEAVALWVSGHILQLLESEVSEEKTPIENLNSIYKAHVKFISSHPGIPRFMFSKLIDRDKNPSQKIISSLMFQYRNILAEQIKKGIERGCISSKVNVDAAISLYIGSIQGLAVSLLLDNKEVNMNLLADNIFDIFIEGIESKA